MRFTKTLLTTALFGASVFSFQSTAWADTTEQQFQQGFEATERGDYQTAFKLWLPLAEQGDANAQFILGVMYANGRGVRQSYQEAERWYRKAAEDGFSPAQHNLGEMYYEGKGVHQNYTEALQWYLKAAEQGFSPAQNRLGEMYEEGQGVPKNPKVAKEWHKNTIITWILIHDKP